MLLAPLRGRSSMVERELPKLYIGFDSLRPLQNSPNVFIPQIFSDSYVTALVIFLQRGHTADGAA